MVSIIIPFFNRSKLVCKTISYIVGQTYSNWELIMIDDGSEELDFQAVKDKCVKDCRINIIKRPKSMPKGAQSCRNFGLELATGEYIIFFDSDDFIPEYCLNQRVSYMEQHPDLDFSVFPYAEFIDDPNKPEIIGGLQYYEDDLKAFVARRLPFMVWSNIYKTVALRKNMIHWDTNLKSLQDAFFNISVICAGLKYGFAENCLIDYYNRIGNKGTSISKGIYSPDHFDSHIYYLESVRNVVANKEAMTKPLRDGCLYIYSLMMYNYSKEHCTKLISCLSHDKWFYLITRMKDSFYRMVLIKLHINTNISRWILFPSFSFMRKMILKQHRDYCVSNAKISNITNSVLLY